MIGGFQFLFISLLFSAAKAELLGANDAQTCMDLCTSCEGTASFENGLCECVVPEGNKLGIECVKRLKRDTEKFDLNSAASDLETSERSARCSTLGSRRRFGSADAERVANYFMNGGPLTGSSLLGRSNPDCSSSSKDKFTGASNPNVPQSRPKEPLVERKVEPPVAKSPVVGAPNSPACSDSQYHPIVSTQWLPNYGMGYSPIVGAHQPFVGSYYPHMWLGSIPHMVQGIPNALMRATHIPAPHHQHPGLLGAPQHSPLLSALASRTHGVLQHLDNVVSSYATQHPPGNIVGAPHALENPCAQHSSQPSYSNLVGAPRSEAHPPSPKVLQQVLAHQNTLLEALSNQLASYSPQVGAPRMQYPYSHYPYTHPHMLGAPNPMGHCYCPDNGSSSTVGAANPNAPESPSKSAEDSTKDEKIVKAPSPKKDSKMTDDDDDSSDDSDEEVSKAKDNATKSDDEKATVGAAETTKKEETEEKAEQKSKRESRVSSSIRRKRGDVKYVSKKSSQ